MEITKIFRFEGSHIVRNCSSHRCSHSVHGHSYVVEITFEGRKLDNAQMLMDFGLMKGSIKDFIDSMDHCHIMCSTDSSEYNEFFRKTNDRWIEVPFNPSAEMLSVFIMRFVQLIVEHTKFNNGEGSDLVVKNVTVHETVTGRAKCDAQDVKNLWNDMWMVSVCFSNGVIKDWSKDLKNLLMGDGNYIITNPSIKKQINLPEAN